MSSSSDIAITLPKMSVADALLTPGQALARLVERDRFDFCGYGEILALDFLEGTDIDERLFPDAPTTIADIDPAALAAREPWFCIGGSIVTADSEALDLDLMLVPTGDPVAPAWTGVVIVSTLVDLGH